MFQFPEADNEHLNRRTNPAWLSFNLARIARTFAAVGAGETGPVAHRLAKSPSFREEVRTGRRLGAKSTSAARRRGATQCRHARAVTAVAGSRPLGPERLPLPAGRKAAPGYVGPRRSRSYHTALQLGQWMATASPLVDTMQVSPEPHAGAETIVCKRAWRLAIGQSERGTCYQGDACNAALALCCGGYWSSIAGPTFQCSCTKLACHPGVVGNSSISIGHATLQLPPGEWRVLATSDSNPAQNGGQSLAMQSKVLAQVVGGKITSLIRIKTNVTRSSHGWAASERCGWRDVISFDNASEYDNNYDCTMIDYRSMVDAVPPNPLWLDAEKAAAQFGGIPKPMIVSEYNKASSNRLDFLAVVVYFNPAQAGIVAGPLKEETGESDWSKARINAARQAFVNQVAAWGKAYRPTIANAL